MSKDRTEYADIEAAPITGSNDRRRTHLVGNSDSRTLGIGLSSPVHIAGDAADTGDVQVAGIQIQQRSVPWGVDRLWEVELIAKPVVDRQLRGCSPGVLPIEEEALLELLRIG